MRGGGRQRSPLWLDILYPARDEHDAIATHGMLLAAELAATGASVRVTNGGGAALWRRVLTPSCDWVLVQYMPYSYGRWGFAPQLVLAGLLARIVPGSPRIALMVHEAYSQDVEGPRRRLMGLWQREQFRLLAALAHRVFGSTDDGCAKIRRLLPRKAVIRLPIPSTIPVAGHDYGVARSAVGIAPEELALTVMGNDHPSRVTGPVEAAMEQLAAAGRSIVLINLGARAAPMRVPPAVREVRPGPLSASELSLHLAATDIYLLALSDGVSTRRTTFAAALAHGLAMVATDGAQTDALLRGSRSALVLVPVDRPELFAQAVLDLARDEDRRTQMGAAAQGLYERWLAWPKVAEVVETALHRPRG